MDTGCPECDRSSLVNGKRCPKHHVEYLEWIAEAAKQDYDTARKEYEAERKQQSEHSPD